MNCRLYRALFRLLPFAPLRGWLESRHLGRCPDCMAEFGLSDEELSRLAPAASGLASGIDLWPELRRRLGTQNRRQAANVQRWLRLFIDLVLLLGLLLAVVILFFVLAGGE
jgi:hypothetical protein